MAPPRSTNRKKAFDLWQKSGRTMQLKDIAAKLGVSDVLVRKWKFLDSWDEIPAKRPRGAPVGNQNAVGNKGGGAPEGNTNALKHGMYAKYLPDELIEIAREIEENDPVEIIWNNIVMLQARLLHAQRIIHVRDKDDESRTLKKVSPGKFGDGEEWLVQFAHDKFASAAKAEVMIMRELRSAIDKFHAMAPENDVRRLRLDMMQSQIDRTKLTNEKLKLQVAEMGGKTSNRKLESFL